MTMFKTDKCTRCGECFTRCRYMNLSRQQAIEEIDRLIKGDSGGEVMKKCVSCQSCDVFCPEDARPYELILEKLNDKYNKTGLPVRALYMLPYQHPNYREDMVPLMSDREKELLTSWKKPPKSGEILYPGCNLLTMPLLFDLKVLKNLPVYGDWEQCCGEPYFRLGALDVVEKIAHKLGSFYTGKG